MNKIFTLFILSGFTLFAKAQTSPSNPTIMPFGVIDTADLRMTSCDFEKDANAMVLFELGLATYKYDEIIMERHKRIKIFNEKGKDEANIRIEFFGAHRDEIITDVEAETINLDHK